MIWSKEKNDSERIDTLVAHDVVIKGDVEFSGGIQIDGRVIGNVKGFGEKSVIRITDRAKVDGNIHAPIIIINGQVTGNIYSHSLLELESDAHVTGDVHYQLIEMAIGAEINGQMIHEILGVQEKRSDEFLEDALKGQFSATVDDESRLSTG